MILSDQQFDFLTEIINIGIGRSANVLNKIVKSRVKLYVPKIQLLPVDELARHIDPKSGGDMSLVSMSFKGDLKGIVALVFSSGDAVKIVDLITDKNYEQLEMDQLRSSTLNEVGNIVLNSLIGTLGNILKSRFQYSIPKYVECKSHELIENKDESSEYMIYAETHFNIKDNEIDGSFMLFFEVGSLDAFIDKLEEHSK